MNKFKFSEININIKNNKMYLRARHARAPTALQHGPRQEGSPTSSPSTRGSGGGYPPQVSHTDPQKDPTLELERPNESKHRQRGGGARRFRKEARTTSTPCEGSARDVVAGAQGPQETKPAWAREGIGNRPRQAASADILIVRQDLQSLHVLPIANQREQRQPHSRRRKGKIYKRPPVPPKRNFSRSTFPP